MYLKFAYRVKQTKIHTAINRVKSHLDALHVQPVLTPKILDYVPKKTPKLSFLVQRENTKEQTTFPIFKSRIFN